MKKPNFYCRRNASQFPNLLLLMDLTLLLVVLIMFTLWHRNRNSLKCVGHVLLLSQRSGNMSKFLKCFTLSISGPLFSRMALVTDKQNVGRKSSKRKRSTMVKSPVMEVCSIKNRRGYSFIAKRLVRNKKDKSKERGNRKNIVIVRP